MPKIKLSETLKFLTGRINKMTGSQLELDLDVAKQAIKPGNQLQSRATLMCPKKGRQVDYVAISLRGQVQRDGQWQAFVKSAEVAQEIRLPADYEFVIPVVLHIPEDAVFTQDGAHWHLQARASINKAVDCRAEAEFEVRP